MQSSKQFLHFDITSSVRKTKADRDVELGSSAEKRQKVMSPLKFSGIQKVSKKTLQQQRVPSPEVSPTKITASLVYSSLVMTLNGSPREGTRSNINVILIAVKKRLVSKFER